MLSRSNSNAGQRLRRAKSTTSTHTSSSIHQAAPTLGDPSIGLQYAETAAVEAFNRARQCERTNSSYRRPVPTRPQRRKSTTNSGAEGSHFENARLERRHSTSKKRNNQDVRSKTVRQDRSCVSEDGARDRKTDGFSGKVEDDPNLDYPNISDRPLVSAINDTQRFGQQESSTPCRGSSQREQASFSRLQLSSTDECGSHTPHGIQISDQNGASGATGSKTLLNPIKRLPLQRPPTDDEARALARDKCLRDFQQRKVRERKSFLVDTIQKFRPSTSHKQYRGGYDNSLPPFNYADSGLTPPTIPLVELQLPDSTLYVDPNARKTRSFSETLKLGLKKLIRRSSVIPRQLPAQHIEATQLHQPVISLLSTPIVNASPEDDPFTFPVECEPLITSSEEPESAQSQLSIDAVSTSGSRVTSWTTSTVTGTCSTTNDSKQYNKTEVDTGLLRSSSISTLRGARFSIGGSIKRKLRRKSKSLLNSSEESTALYAALQERIHPETKHQQMILETGQSDDSVGQSALNMLPSQQRCGKPFHLPKNLWIDSTIRSVTPELKLHKSEILSPVVEVLSPPTVEQTARLDGDHNPMSNSTPKSQLHRRRAIRAPVPSKAQIAKRVQRNDNRWQGPLDELSPQEVGLRHLLYKGDNPYQLSSLNRISPPSNGFIHDSQHVRTAAHITDDREAVLSPSLYSCATDDASPHARSATPPEQGGTMVTITGHEVRSYPISPTKNRGRTERSASQNSRDWRRWLSNELRDWKHDGSPEPLSLPNNSATDQSSLVIQPSILKATPGQETNDASGSSTPTHEAPVGQKKRDRPVATRRRSGFMNERYPILASVEDFPDRKSKNRNSSLGFRNTIDGSTTKLQDESHVQKDTSTGKGTLLEDVKKPYNTLVAEGPLSSDTKQRNQKGLANLTKDAIANHPLLNKEMRTSGDQARKPPTQQGAPLHARSTSDLQVNYKSDRSARSKALEVRRRPQYDYNPIVLEDSTIQNISAGPYASAAVNESKQPSGIVYDNSFDMDKENTPCSGADHLPHPAESSKIDGVIPKSRALSESTVHRGTKGFTSVQPKPVVGVGRGSPGQRLVTGWLDAKKSKENSPVAFL